MEEITEEVISKNEKIYSLVVILVVIFFVLSFIRTEIILYAISTVLLLIPFFLYRFYYIVKMYLSGETRISIIPRIREEKSRAIKVLIIFLIFLFSPAALLYLLPFPAWIAETLALISSWLFSTLLGWILIREIENKHKGKLIRYYIIDEVLDEIVIKEYGYKITTR